MKVIDATEAPAYNARSIGAGATDVRTLLEGENNEPDNFRLNFGSVSEAWDVPRHRHNFDQIRFPIAGEFEYAEGKILPAGWVGYFPEGVHYGPQVRRAGLVMLLLQFGGASGYGFLGKDRRKAAIDELKKRGRFERGAYFTADETGAPITINESTAIWETATKTPLVYPKPRYESLIMMNPESFAWIKTEQPGLARKHLGTFTERDLQVGFVRLDSGTPLRFPAAKASTVLFMVEGAFSYGGRVYGPHSAIGCAPGEAIDGIEANEESVFLHVQLPRF